MAQQIVFPYGDVQVSLTATQAIAVRTTGPGNPASVYRQAGFPNYPNSYTLLGTVSDEEKSFGPFTGGGVIKIEAGPNQVFYNVDANPMGAVVFGAPIGTPSFFGYFTDFVEYDSNTWTITETGSGTDLSGDEVGGTLVLTNAAADNDKHALQLGKTNGECFKFTGGKALWFDARFKVDNVLADTMIGLYVTDTDPEGGVSDGVYFRRLTTATALNLVIEASSTETVVTTGIVMANDTYVNVGFYYDGAKLFYTQNRQIIGEATSLANLPTGELRLSLLVQNGTAVARSMTVDWVGAHQQR
jgi:hypothetical protein